MIYLNYKALPYLLYCHYVSKIIHVILQIHKENKVVCYENNARLNCFMVIYYLILYFLQILFDQAQRSIKSQLLAFVRE